MKKLAAAGDPFKASTATLRDRVASIKALGRSGEISADDAAAAEKAAAAAYRKALAQELEDFRSANPILITSRDLTEGLDLKAHVLAEISPLIAKVREVSPDMKSLQAEGERFVDTVLNPQSWSSSGDLGKTVVKELEQEFLKLATLNPLRTSCPATTSCRR